MNPTFPLSLRSGFQERLTPILSQIPRFVLVRGAYKREYEDVPVERVLEVVQNPEQGAILVCKFEKGDFYVGYAPHGENFYAWGEDLSLERLTISRRAHVDNALFEFSRVFRILGDLVEALNAEIVRCL